MKDFLKIIIALFMIYTGITTLIELSDLNNEIGQLKSRNEYLIDRHNSLQKENKKFRDSVVFSDTIVIALPEGQRRILYRVEGELHE